MKRLAARVVGRVQGVFFRLSAKAQAEALGLTGFVRNEPDGSVLVEVQGDEPALQAFVAWCKIGSELAQIAKVEVRDSKVKKERGFAIR